MKPIEMRAEQVPAFTLPLLDNEFDADIDIVALPEYGAERDAQELEFLP